MKPVRIRLYEYMKAEGLADSTICEYLKQYDLIKKSNPGFDEWNSEQCVSYLAGVDDPVYRSSKRNIILKVHRDMMGKQMNIPFIKKPVRLQKYYLHHEVQQIFAQITNKKHEAIARLLYVEGFRVGEIVSILKADCCKMNNTITIRATKNKRDYIKHLDASTVKCLGEYCQWLRQHGIKLKQYLFEGNDYNQYTKRSIQQIMLRAIDRAGLDRRGSCHVFRRSNAVFKLENGWNMQYIAASLNNTVGTVKKYYALVRPEYIKQLPKPQI